MDKITLTDICLELFKQQDFSWIDSSSHSEEINNRKSNSRPNDFIAKSGKFHEKFLSDIGSFISGKMKSEDEACLLSYFNIDDKELLIEQLKSIEEENSEDASFDFSSFLKISYKEQRDQIRKESVNTDLKKRKQLFDTKYSKEFIKFLLLNESETDNARVFRKFRGAKFESLSFDDWVSVIDLFETQLKNSVGSDEEKEGARSCFISYFNLVNHYQFYLLNKEPKRKEFLNWIASHNQNEHEFISSVYLQIERKLEQYILSLFKGKKLQKILNDKREELIEKQSDDLASMTVAEIEKSDSELYLPHEKIQDKYEKEFWISLKEQIEKDQ